MKKNIKLCSVLSLLGLLCSCGRTGTNPSVPSSLPSSKPSQSQVSSRPSDSAKESDTGSASVSKPGSSAEEVLVDPTSIKIDSKFKSLKRGEVAEIVCSFEPSDAKKDFTLSTDDTDYIEIFDGNKIRAIKNTPLGKKVSLIATTPNELESVYRFTISSDSVNDEKIDDIVNKLNASQKLGMSSLSSGSLSIKVEEDGKLSQTGDYSYQVFEGGLHSEVVSSVFEDNTMTETVSSRLIKGSRYMKASATKSGSDWVANTNSFDSLSVVASPDPDNRYEISMEDAKNRVSSISIEGYTGLEGFIINEYLNQFDSFGSSTARTYMDITKTNDTDYSLSYDYILEDDEGKMGFTETMELGFDLQGRLDMVEVHGGYYDGDDPTKTLLGDLDLSAEQEFSVREADTESSFDFSKYFFTDFESYFTGSPTYEASVLPRLDYYVGETAYLKLKSSSPSTASDRLDEIVITKVSDPSVCSVSKYKNQLSFLKAGDCEVTVCSSVNQIEKTYTFHVKDPVVTEISWGDYYKKNYLASYLLSGCSKEIKIASLPQYESSISSKPLSTPVIDSVVSSNPSILEVKKAANGSSFTVSAKEVSEPSKVTLTLTEKVLGASKPLTKDITVYPDTDKGIAKMLSSETIYAMNQSFFPSPFAFTLNEDGVSGKVSLPLEFDSDYTAESDFKVVNGDIQITMGSGFWAISEFKFRDKENNCNHFDFDLYYSVDQSYFYGQETDSTTGEPLLGSCYAL